MSDNLNKLTELIFLNKNTSQVTSFCFSMSDSKCLPDYC